MIYSGQGPIGMGDYDPINGTAGQGYLVNVKRIGCGNRVLKTTFKQDTQKLKETDSGQRMTILILEKGKEAAISLDMVDFDRAMLAMAMYGTTALKAAGAVTGEAFPTVAAGDVVHTKHPRITSAGTPVVSTLVITDSTAVTPVNLVEGTHYKVDSADHGRINILNVTGLTQPLKADYQHAAYGNIAAFTANRVMKGLIFDGINTTDGSKVRVIIPRIMFSPTKDFNWMGDAEATLALDGEVLYSTELAADPDFGPFMRVDGLPS